MNFDFSKVMEEAEKVSSSGIVAKAGHSGSHNVPSFGVVNNENGMRISLNSLLMDRLNVQKDDEIVDVLPIKSLRSVLIAKKLQMKAAVTVSLRPVKGTQTRVAYCADVVKWITDDLNLNYSDGTTSRSSTDIQFHQDGGVPVAVVTFDDVSAGTMQNTDAEAEQEATA